MGVSAVRWPVSAILVLVLVYLTAPPARAYRTLYASWLEGECCYSGDAAAEVGDVDGNGISDFVVGSTGYDDGGFNTGRAYLFLPEPDGTITAPLILTSGAIAGLFGKDIAAAGDVNADGFADFLITSENIRAVHLFLGAADRANISRVVIPSPNNERSTAAVGVGDVDGDGYDDFVVGALWDDVAWLYRGGATIDPVPDLVLSGSGEFGFTAAPLGDINHDGFADFVVGAPYFEVAGDPVGAVLVFHGGSPPDAVPDTMLVGDQPYEGFGRPLQLGGDLNGDGFRDLVVAAPSFNGSQGESGRLDIFYLGGAVGTMWGTSIFGESSDEVFIFDAKADIDLDGLPDIVVGGGLGIFECPITMISGVALRFATTLRTGTAGQRYDMRAADITSVADLDGDGFRELLLPSAVAAGGTTTRPLLLAGGHRVMPRFRVADAAAAPGDTLETTLFVVLDSSDPEASVELASLDLRLTFDYGEVLFLGADPVAGAESWLYRAVSQPGAARIAMATPNPIVVGPTEKPLLTLRFLAGNEPERTRVEAELLEAHASGDIPLWPLFKPGTLAIEAVTQVPAAFPAGSVRVHPNPFNPRTTVTWTSPGGGPTTIRILDARGREVWRGVDDTVVAGTRQIRWQGVDGQGHPVPSGTYLVEVHGSAWLARTKMTLVR